MKKMNKKEYGPMAVFLDSEGSQVSFHSIK